MTIEPTAPDAAFIAGMRAELARARAKFPKQSQLTTLAALAEEGFEVVQAVLAGKSPTEIRAEATQLAVMAMRLAVECAGAPEELEQ
jgi:hypothetical protein